MELKKEVSGINIRKKESELAWLEDDKVVYLDMQRE